MIISHRHRFIFLKTNKTAGTSIEMVLRRHHGPDDIATPFLPEKESAWLEPPPLNFLLENKAPFYRKAIYKLRGRPVPELPRMKTSYQDRTKPYRDFYDWETCRKVARWYRREIACFRYEI